jgi:hypothetical protein
MYGSGEVESTLARFVGSTLAGASMPAIGVQSLQSCLV